MMARRGWAEPKATLRQGYVLPPALAPLPSVQRLSLLFLPLKRDSAACVAPRPLGSWMLLYGMVSSGSPRRR